MLNKNLYVRYFSLNLLLILFISCSKDKLPELSSENELTNFIIKKEKQPHLWFDMTSEIIGDTIFVRTLKGTDVSALVPEFEHKGVKITVNNLEQVSGTSKQDFSKVVKYDVVAENGNNKTYIVKVIDTGLPAVYLTTDGKPIDSKDVYVQGNITITRGFEGTVIYEGKTEVKGRGNSTWWMPKKPYRIKLDKKAELLGMPADKSWALMANYGDQSLLRNDVAFEVSRRLELEYTPRQHYVEFFLNGEYMGNYTLTEHVKEGENRIPIDEDNGGFIIEEDGYAYSEPVNFTTNKGMPITVKFPDEDDITDEQFNYIKDYIASFENSLFNSNNDPSLDYQKYFDLKSFVNYYLINEICGNPDMLWSMRMYKKSNLDPKIYVGPVWDFDLAFNNDKRLQDTQNKLMLFHAHEPRAWMNKFLEDPEFKKLVRSRWKEIKNNLTSLPQYIDQRNKLISFSQPYNFMKWEILGININQSWYIGVSHQDYVDFIKNFITARLTWLDTQFSDPQFD